MKQSRRRHGRAFQAKVALAALRGDQTIEVAVFTNGTTTLFVFTPEGQKR